MNPMPVTNQAEITTGQLGPSGADATSRRVGSDAVKTPAEAAAKIHAAQKAKKDAVPLLVSRDGTTYYLALQLVNS